MTQENGGQVEVEGFGMRARVRGHDVIVVVLLLVLFLGVGYLIFDHDRKSEERIGLLTISQQKVVEEVSALTYVMTLTAEERAKLKLDMPDALRKKLKEQR